MGDQPGLYDGALLVRVAGTDMEIGYFAAASAEYDPLGDPDAMLEFDDRELLVEALAGIPGQEGTDWLLVRRTRDVGGTASYTLANGIEDPDVRCVLYTGPETSAWLAQLQPGAATDRAREELERDVTRILREHAAYANSTADAPVRETWERCAGVPRCVSFVKYVPEEGYRLPIVSSASGGLAVVPDPTAGISL